VRGRRVR
jgi:hypothetical protein